MGSEMCIRDSNNREFEEIKKAKTILMRSIDYAKIKIIYKILCKVILSGMSQKVFHLISFILLTFMNVLARLLAQ